MASRKSVITFGMVAIPIAMSTATRDNDIHFNQLHKEDHSRIRLKTYPTAAWKSRRKTLSRALNTTRTNMW